MTSPAVFSSLSSAATRLASPRPTTAPVANARPAVAALLRPSALAPAQPAAAAPAASLPRGSLLNRAA